MSKLKYLFLGISLFMVCLALRTSLQSDMFHLSPQVIREPWFWTTLVDFYFNITIISVWVIYKEHHLLKSMFWVAAFILLGSIATSFYVFLQLNRLREGQTLEEVLCRRSSH